jgi:phosphate starvation-inducible PhoH-like protein
MSGTRDRSGARKTRKESRSGARSNAGLIKNVKRERETTEITRAPVKPKRTAPKPLNDAQRAYDLSIRANIITFGIGPAGSGKTWYAASCAAEALNEGEIERIIVTRPAVEAEEELGFLPGDINEKFEPYLRPVKDVFEEYFGSGHLEYLLKRGIIEARPLAYLRGATFKNALVILDEAQNVTAKQMKMFLTRIGENCRVIINGDPDQSDLPHSKISGLMDAAHRLADVKRVGRVDFAIEDIVRSGICKDIVLAYL